MSNLLSPTGEFPAFNPSARQVLPASAAVKGPRFSTSNHWAVSSVAREVLDSFDLPLRPAPAARELDPAESIIMSGNEIVNSLRTGSHVVKQRRTVDFDALPELAIAEPFAVVPDTSVRDAAGQALAALNERKPHARRSHRLPRKPLKAPRATQPDMVAVAIVFGGLVIAALVAVARGSL